MDGVLHVATHYGLFTVDDGDTTMVSEDDHDFMGFTVVDDGTFLASGHPNSRTDLPGHLGLLESSDGGRTWEEVSLTGEVDFHALDAKAGVVFGFDSGTAQLMSSDDRENWTQHGQFSMSDVAISSDDADTVLITTESGPLVSEDGGESFEPLDGAPVVVLVDWPRPDELYAVAPDGAIHRSADGGSTWDSAAELSAQPQAMTVAPDGAVYVALEDSLVVSEDEGETFSDLYTWKAP
ncbi:F510_1955 family glycosylhydrolase [Phytoactinopolyspora endophytica]|uniref:F510_1955 family glycosylhydrolase n=1 Tax=Phytoactinopolyspora endophytica TaxID=1642495 RepID=UPI0013ED49F4|nr:exo-alpha-sialidase [Phytoactinopolyspora endophytica]